MFCKNCGAPMEDDASFCTACGTKVTRPEQQPAADPAPAGTGAAPAGEGGQPSYAPAGTPTQPSYTSAGAPTQSTYAPAPAGGQPGGPVPGAPAKKKGPPTKIIAIAAAAVVVVVAIVAAVKLLGGGSGGGRNVNIDDEINFNNGGQYAYNESYCYYIGAYNDSDESTSLYRTDRSGGNKIQISTNSKVGKFRLVDDKILYRESLDEGYAIGTMGLDGSEPTTIIELEESPSKFDIRDGKLIYLVGDELRWCTLTGEEDALLQSGVETFTLYGDSLYYAKENTLWEYGWKDGTPLGFCYLPADSVYDLLCDGQKIYIRSSEGLQVTSRDGKEGSATTLVADSDPDDDRIEIGSYVIEGDTIYYKQFFEDDYVEAMAWYMAEDSSDYTTYYLLLLGTGEIHSVNKNGGSTAAAETDQGIVYTLYAAPDGMLSQPSLFSDTFNTVVFEGQSGGSSSSSGSSSSGDSSPASGDSQSAVGVG